MSSPTDFYYPIGLSLIALNVTAVSLRFWARRISRSTGYDDWTLAVALAMFVVFVAIYLRSADLGVGDHLDGVLGRESWQCFTVAGVAHYLALAFSKLSVGLVLYRLTDQTGMLRIRAVLIATMVSIMIACLVGAALLSTWYQRMSGAAAAGVFPSKEETLRFVSAVGISGLIAAIVDLGVSWFYALLPIHFLRQIQLPTKVKILASIILGLGAASSAIAIMRVRFTVHVAVLPAEEINSPEEKVLALKYALLSIAEIGISIFAASLSAVRPILVKASTWTSSITSSFATTRKLSSSKIQTEEVSAQALTSISPETQKSFVCGFARQVSA